VQEGTIHHLRSEMLLEVQLTPSSRALLENPVFPQAVEKFPASQGNRVLYRVKTVAIRPYLLPDESSVTIDGVWIRYWIY
jgi:hypothetical protein